MKLFGRHKPRDALEVDYSNEISNGLLVALPLMQQGRIKNLVRNEPHNWSLAGSATWTPDGPQFVTDTGGSPALISDSYTNTPEGTSFGVFKKTTTDGFSLAHFFYQQAFSNHSFYQANNGVWYICGSNVDSGSDGVTSWFGLPIGEEMRIGFDWNTTTDYLHGWSNGRQMTEYRPGFNVTTGPYHVGGRTDNTLRFISGAVKVFYQWDRVLSEGEQLSLNKDPYQIFKPAVEKSYFIPSQPTPAVTKRVYRPQIRKTKIHNDRPMTPFEVDWSNPITRGMVAAFAPGGVAWRDYVNAGKVPRLASDAPPNEDKMVGTVNGLGLDSQSGAIGYYSAESVYTISFPLTFMAVGICEYILSGKDMGGAKDSAGQERYRLDMFGGSIRFQVRDSTGSGSIATCSSAAVDEEPFVAIGTARESGVNLVPVVYGRGSKIAKAEGTADAVIADMGAFNTFRLQSIEDSGNRFRRPLNLCVLWNRQLSDGEAFSLLDNPFQVFKPILEPVFFEDQGYGIYRVSHDNIIYPGEVNAEVIGKGFTGYKEATLKSGAMTPVEQTNETFPQDTEGSFNVSQGEMPYGPVTLTIKT